jgi:hypothetical protein
MKRPDAQKSLPKGQWACPDKEWVKHYPALCQGMCDTWWDDGKPRDPWSVTLRFEGTAVHGCVNDKGLSMGLYTAGETIDDVLGQLEECIAQGTAQWRRWRK